MKCVGMVKFLAPVQNSSLKTIGSDLIRSDPIIIDILFYLTFHYSVVLILFGVIMLLTTCI